MAAAEVEALCWDLTLGAAGTVIGKTILSATSSSSNMVPEAVDHVGIVVYENLYEFGDFGILKTEAPPGQNPESKYPSFNLRSREVMGQTAKTQQVFEAWVAEQNKGEFRGSEYHLATKSCITWAIEACKFLGVPYPSNWDKLCDWAQTNKTVAGLITLSALSSRGASFKVSGPPNYEQ